MNPSQQHYVLFILGGTSYRLPTNWVLSERRQLVNRIQPSEQGKLLPSISLSSNQLTLSLELPTRFASEYAQLEQLKGTLLQYAQRLSLLKYQGAVDRLPSSVQKSASIAYTALEVGVISELMINYLGAHNYLLGSLVSHFSSTYNPRTLSDEWQIVLEGLNLSAMRLA